MLRDAVSIARSFRASIVQGEQFGITETIHSPAEFLFQLLAFDALEVRLFGPCVTGSLFGCISFTLALLILSQGKLW